MRLQISIQRHGLPATNLLWRVRGHDPSSTSTSAQASTTISQLLEDVNDIVQLESDDWGLEDYVVEVGGYECLHFQPINSVLREDDKVVIRALQTSDLRIRKIGGRHQISADGRHLFDGVAFGRPYLRKTTRPAFRIPPRKRRKLDVGHGQYIEDDTAVQALLPGTVTGTGTALGNTEIDRDPYPDDAMSLQVLTKQRFEDHGLVPAAEEEDSEFDSDFQSVTEDVGEEEMDLSEELKALLEDDPSDTGDNDGIKNDKGFQTESQKIGPDAIRQPQKRKRESGNALADGNMVSANGLDSPAVLASTVHISGSSREVGDRRDSAKAPAPSFDGFNGLAAVGRKSSSVHTNSSGATTSETESQAGSSGVSSSTSESMPSSTTSEAETVSESDSESDTESECQSESESGSKSESQSESVSEAEDEGGITATSFPIVQTTARQDMKMESTLTTRAVSVHVEPGHGLARTHKNNQRIRRRKRLNFLKAAGLLAPEAGFKELSTFEQSKHQSSLLDNPGQLGGLKDMLVARKQEVLEQCARLEVDAIPGPATSGDTAERNSPDLTDTTSTVLAQPVSTTSQEVAGTGPDKRARLDIESSRRMVFGSLGLKTPKIPAAERALRESLAKQQARSVTGRHKGTVTGKSEDSQASAKPASTLMEAGAWRDRIVLSAVECEAEGQLLSTPPFPFVQRWQQEAQENVVHGHLDKHGNANAARQLDGSTAADDLDSLGVNGDGGRMVDELRLNGAIQNQLLQEAQELSQRQDASPVNPDLPLITEVSGLEALKAEDAVAGAVIAFKQLEMSKKTNWQPEISPYRTARVQERLDDGTLIILLAERDRADKLPSLNGQTGERVFDKFEMPLEGEEGPDHGIREVSYNDLIEPKILECNALNASLGQVARATDNSTSGLTLDGKISDTDDSGKLVDASAKPPSAHVEVSTPRQKEISRLIKDAGFHSSLDQELLQQTPNSTEAAMRGAKRPQASPLASEQPSGSLTTDLDGTAAKSETACLSSPLFAGSRSSSVHRDNNFHSTWNNLAQEEQFSSMKGSQEEGDSGSKKDIAYPKISQLVTGDPSRTTMKGEPQASNNYDTEPSKNGQPNDHSDIVAKDNDSIFEPEESYFDSLERTTAPSEHAAPKSGPPSTSSSRITNPCYTGLDGNASSEDDLPSLSEITSTARSGRVPPSTKKEVVTGRGKESPSPEPSASTNEGTSSESHDQTQTSSMFQPSQIPQGSEIVDLRFSSDPISLDHSEGEYGSRRRSSVRIKQGGSQVKTRNSLLCAAKIGNRRLVRGSSGALRR